MDFDFGNNSEPKKPEEENDSPFSFNLDNNDADTDNSVSDNASPFDWTPDEIANSEESDPIAITNEDLISDVSNEEEPPQLPDITEESLEEVTADAEDDNVSDNLFDETPSQVTAEEPFDEQTEETVPEAEVFEEPSEDVPEAEVSEEQPEDAPEAEVFEEPSEDAPEAEAFEEPAEDAPEAEIFEAPAEETVPAPAALDKKVRTPDGEQEYLLSELIDVETGEPLDLTSLIPEGLLTAAVTESAGGFSMETPQTTTGGFDMSAGSESTAPSKRKRPARPKASSKKGGSIVGIIFGGLLAFILFPYVMALIEMTTGAQSNIPIPAPGIKSTYKYIPEWWPEWAMFVFPGRTAETADTPADVTAQPKADNAAPADNAVPAENEAPADDAAAADDGSFDPDAFLANDGAENAAEPKDVLADEPAADEPVEPGVVNAPQYTSADVSEAVAAVGTAFKAAKAIDDTVYAALNDMAEKSTFVDTTAVDDQLKDSMSKVRAAMGNFGTKPALASALSEKWAARVEDESDNAGVLFVGTLSGVAERDGYQINTIDIDGQDGSVEVVGLRKIKPAVGDKVVVCGKRIADPAKNLGGFTDNGQPVVWGGIVIKAENK